MRWMHLEMDYALLTYEEKEEEVANCMPYYDERRLR